jgi:dCMP deaminase
MEHLISEIQNTNDKLSWDQYFITLSFLISNRSSCKRLKVGCVLVKDTRVISVGYNGFLPGFPHESIVRDNHEQATVHAEQNCITDCAKRGINASGATAYVTHYPCINCLKLLVASGITSIKYYNDYKNDDIIERIINGQNIRLEKMKLENI